jgi:hypothetical protein
MRIDSSGNVGIGVVPSVWSTNFSNKALQIGPAGFISSLVVSDSDRRFTFTNNAFDNSAGVVTRLQTGPVTRYNQAGGVHTWSNAASDSAGTAVTLTERMRIDSSGNVGIGTSSPTGGKLQVNHSASEPGVYIFENNAGLELHGVANVGGKIAASTLTFNTGSGRPERMRINSDAVILMAKSVNTNSVQGFAFNPDGALRITTDGASSFTSVGFYRNSSASPVGTITTTSTATAYNTSSDYRLKENVAPMTGALDKIAALKPCIYTWKVDGSAGEGFIAHELAEVCPAAVTGGKDATEIQQVEVSPAVYEDVVIPAVLDEDGNEVEPERIEKRLVSEAVMEDREVPVYQGVDTSFLVANLTAAIQELKAELDSAKEANAALEARITAIENGA